MLNHEIITALVINGAALSHLSAFFFTNQVRLRIFLLMGNALYAIYYLTVTDEPLWMPLFWSVMFIGANSIVLIKQLKINRTSSRSFPSSTQYELNLPLK